MKEIYLISGLGGDKRVFEYLQFGDFKLNHLEWIRPEMDESMQRYAKRLSAQIITPRPILIGVSFGGMIAVEIAKLIETDKVIVISSAKSVRNIPGFNKIAKTKFFSILPVSFLKYPNAIMYWFFGVRSAKERQLLKSIIKETDSHFLPWALGKVLTWDNSIELPNVISIHGSRDRLIPLTRADFIIQEGGHLMIVSHHKEVSAILNEILHRPAEFRNAGLQNKSE